MPGSSPIGSLSTMSLGLKQVHIGRAIDRLDFISVSEACTSMDMNQRRERAPRVFTWQHFDWWMFT